MLTNTLTLLNLFLSTTDFYENPFLEKDFQPIERDYQGHYMLAKKRQWITYKGYTFRVYIYCEVETQLDEISKMQFSSKDMNDNNQDIVLEYLSNISIMFSCFISIMLYLILDKEAIREFYEKALYKLNEQKLCLNHDKLAGGGVIHIITPAQMIDLKHLTFFVVLITDENEVIIGYTIDLYNQYND